MKEVTIIGGGLAGLFTAIQLARADIPVQLLERKKYPFHRVCGEYISNETVPFLRSISLFPIELDPVEINQFQLTSTNGVVAQLPLTLGGFGISRYAFDHWLFKKATALGVNILEEAEVNEVIFQEDRFQLRTHSAEHQADIVVGAFGKRSKIDRTMARQFISKSSPYIGVKYHIRFNHPRNLISLHNFKDGYCGISQVENGISNLCYLSHRNNLKKNGNIKTMEENVLYQNPFLKDIFLNADFLFKEPETINEISFETKRPVENHVLMSGDAAGMITPLCGNGMAMAIHSSKLLSELLIRYCNNEISREKMEDLYALQWTNHFRTRLWVGRQLQKLFGSTLMSNVAVATAKTIKPLGRYLITKTHGQPF